jgi:hypothetical protein
MNKNTPASNICNYVMTSSLREPVNTRIQLYRDLAKVVPGDTLSNEITQLADELESLNRRTNQLLLKLKLDTEHA